MNLKYIVVNLVFIGHAKYLLYLTRRYLGRSNSAIIGSSRRPCILI